MEKYNYAESIMNDIRHAIEQAYPDKLSEFAKGNISRRDLVDTLYDNLYYDDNVTGNLSGHYAESDYVAEEYICHNIDLLKDAFDDAECGSDVLSLSPRTCDVIIRCYLLYDCLEAVIDEY